MAFPGQLRQRQWWTRLAPLGALYVIKRATGRRMVVMPHGPSSGHILFKVFLWLGLGVPRSGAPGEHAIVTEGGTFLTRAYPESAWNARCVDISKATVQRLFADAFGYPLGLDPRTHSGQMVEKSDANAKHDGRIVEGPAEPMAGKVYSRVVANVSGGVAEDLRTTIVRGRIACVYRKLRPLSDRFSNTNSSVVLIDSSATFSDREASDILRLASAIGLDFGEMDILRDRGDGRIYVVDINKTPVGPPNGIAWLDHYRAVRRIALAFREAMEGA